MTQNERAAYGPMFPKNLPSNGRQIVQLDIGRASPDRMQAANEVGSAIAHQLYGPLTALRLYVGYLRDSRHRVDDATTRGDVHRMVESAFHEIEHVCGMMDLITESFEKPLHPDTAIAVARDAIGWWSRSGRTDADVAAAPDSFALLTPREREVLGHISEGCSNKQGAIRMKITPRTFEGHRAHVMQKLGARNGADLVRMALAEKSLAP